MEVWDAQSPALFSALMDSPLLFRANDGGEGHGGLAGMATREAPLCIENRISTLLQACGASSCVGRDGCHLCRFRLMNYKDHGNQGQHKDLFVWNGSLILFEFHR